MKKRNAGFSAALLLLSLIFVLSQITPEKVSRGFCFFKRLPGISAPACIILAIAVYAIYYVIDTTDHGQH